LPFFITIQQQQTPFTRHVVFYVLSSSIADIPKAVHHHRNDAHRFYYHATWNADVV